MLGRLRGSHPHHRRHHCRWRRRRRAVPVAAVSLPKASWCQRCSAWCRESIFSRWCLGAMTCSTGAPDWCAHVLRLHRRRTRRWLERRCAVSEVARGGHHGRSTRIATVTLYTVYFIIRRMDGSPHACSNCSIVRADSSSNWRRAGSLHTAPSCVALHLFPFRYAAWAFLFRLAGHGRASSDLRTCIVQQ